MLLNKGLSLLQVPFSECSYFFLKELVMLWHDARNFKCLNLYFDGNFTRQNNPFFDA